jgi:hypothetical protein
MIGNEMDRNGWIGGVCGLAGSSRDIPSSPPLLLLLFAALMLAPGGQFYSSPNVHDIKK